MKNLIRNLKLLSGLIVYKKNNAVSLFRCFSILVILLLIISPSCNTKPTGTMPAPEEVPELVIPVYDKLRNLDMDIPLVSDGKATCSIVSPVLYRNAAVVIQNAIEKQAGVKIPIISDTDTKAAIPLIGNLIILGNRSTSKISNKLYNHYYSLIDLKYPGPGGYAVRSLHNPYGNGYSAILVGGSDPTGVSEGAAAFAAEFGSLPASEGNLTVGWTMLTKFGKGVKVPTNLREFETWEDSREYNSAEGLFGRGWNSISIRMALYYMTGDPFHAREMMRLSFPDAQALKEIDEIDGERIENKNDPLAGPYHYNAMMLILFWDLIEESPVFTDPERLKVTNAFARRLNHEGTPPFDKETYKLNRLPSSVSSRHGQWSALSLYTLGRYFNKYYPSPMWEQAEHAGQLSFASLHNHAYVQGEGDQLGWYCTGITPVLTYMIMTGDRIPFENGVLQQLLKGMEVLISGLTPDWALNSATLDFLNKAAYLTGDGRWITYLKRTGLDTDIFRLGQSFWPDENIKPVKPVDLVGKWTINPMSEQMWKGRENNFKLEQSFQNMSYRSTADSTGDYILLKGYNGAYRNPYHTFATLELRLNGITLLKGYNNQVLSSADGMVEPVVAMDAALLYQDVVGQVATAVANVPNLPFTNWQRTLVQRTGKYALITDNLTFRSDDSIAQSDLLVRIETNWEMPGVTWIPQYNYVKIQPRGVSPQTSYELHPSETMSVKKGRITSMVWSRPVRNGQKQNFFYLLAQNTTGHNEGLTSLTLSDNAAALSLPEAAIAVAGTYEGIQGDLVLMTENTFYGHAVRSAGLKNPLIAADVPVELDWDFQSGQLAVVTIQPVKLKLALSSPKLVVNGKTINGKKAGDLFMFKIPSGRHMISGALLPANVIKNLSDQLQILLQQARNSRSQQLEKDAYTVIPNAPALIPVMQSDIGGSPVESIVIPSVQGDLLCTATGKTIMILSPGGKVVRKIRTAGDVLVLHWWLEPKLLLVGCADEEVIAFDEQGKKKWSFTSVMDPAVYEAGKPYWFKSYYPGISGLYSGYFDNDKSRAFIGSSCTLEILDENGQLIKRTPVFWGPIRQFLMVNEPDGTKNLLVGRWQNDRVSLIAIGSKTLSEVRRGYINVPPGHTYVNGWMAMNRYDNFLVDLEGDGKREIVSAINGTWNRITIYSEDGNPLYNAQFGPGILGPRTNMRMMDVGDLDGDGKQEIIVGLSAGFVNALDGQAKKLWAKLLSSPPTVVKIVKETGKTWICVGCEDGTVLAMDASGEILKQAKVTGKPADLRILSSQRGQIAVITTDTGEMTGFRIE